VTIFRPLFSSFGALLLLTGVAYPAVVTGLAQVLYPAKSQGSLIRIEGQVRGSRLIGQPTEDPRYFWGRPVGSSTLAASNPELREAVAQRVRLLRASDPANPAPIPQDLVTASASGLDPDLSPEGAQWQAARVAHQRGLGLQPLLHLIEQHTERPMLSPARVNVLALNMALDGR